jgi:hypothetical protein
MPEIIITTKEYVDGVLIEESAKVISPPPAWYRWVFYVAIPVVLWTITMSGGFR